MPVDEVQRVADVMTSLLSCDLAQVPTELLLHRFLFLFRRQHSSLLPYKLCLRKRHINISSVTSCWKRHLRGTCEDRFGASATKQQQCRDGLAAGWEAPGLTDSVSVAVKGYATCVDELRRVYDQCSPHMVDMCASSGLLTAKTVRLTMASVELMLDTMPNLRVLHLIRDPRAVALSRMIDSTYRAKRSTGKPVREAALYCDSVVRDIVIRQRIERRRPGTVLQVLYDELVADPQRIVANIYSFLNETIPASVRDWLAKSSSGSGNPEKSLQIAEKWQHKLSYRTAQSIGVACRQLFGLIDYDWPAV